MRSSSLLFPPLAPTTISIRYQEDAHAVQSILVPIAALKKSAPGWSPESLEGFLGEETNLGEGGGRRQVAFFGVYDGLVSLSSFVWRLADGVGSKAWRE